MGYHYRVLVPTGLTSDVQCVIEPPDAVAAQVDGSQVVGTNDMTLLTVHSGQLESLRQLKQWADAHPEDPLTVITMVGTPLPVQETELESLLSSVQAHQTLEVEAPARGNMD